MSKDQLIRAARNDIPDDVSIPHSWAGVGAWLLGKFGVGAIFMAMAFFLYNDLKASNERFARLTEANVEAMSRLVQRIDNGHSKVEEMRETIRRIETAVSKQ